VGKGLEASNEAVATAEDQLRHSAATWTTHSLRRHQGGSVGTNLNVEVTRTSLAGGTPAENLGLQGQASSPTRRRTRLRTLSVR
jgi:hypothetical protein